MEEIIDPATQENTTQQPGSNEVLDQIEAEALGMPGGPSADPGEAAQPGSPDEPVKKPFVQPPGAFEHTHAMIVSGIKMVLKKYPGGEEAGKVWESEMFQKAVIPVMVKYNISIYNLPVELVLFGVIVMLAKETVTIMKQAQVNAETKKE